MDQVLNQWVYFCQHLHAVVLQQEDDPLEDGLHSHRQPILLQQSLQESTALPQPFLVFSHGRKGLKQSIVDAVGRASYSVALIRKSADHYQDNVSEICQIDRLKEAFTGCCNLKGEKFGEHLQPFQGLQRNLGRQVLSNQQQHCLHQHLRILLSQLAAESAAQRQYLPEDVQKLLEALLCLGSETFVLAEEQFEDLSEEERQVEGELEVRYLLDGHQPV